MKKEWEDKEMEKEKEIASAHARLI